MSSRPKILLLDPPAPSGASYLLDGYCSQETKAHYRWQPLDLLLQTAYLDPHFQIDVIDAAGTGMTADELIAHISKHKYDAILSLVGWVSLNQNIDVFRRIKQAAPDTQLIVSGDISHYEPEWFLDRVPEVDAILGEMTSTGIIDLLNGTKKPAQSLIMREPKGGIIRGEFDRRAQFAYGIPRHDLFPHNRYRLPFPGAHPFASVVTQVGCPRRCSFCPIAGYDFRTRDMDDLLGETDYLSHNGVKHLYIRDPSLGVKPSHARQLAEAFIKKNYKFTYNAFSNIEGVDADLAKLLRSSGCRILQFGIETSKAETLKAVKKGGDPGNIETGLRATKNAGITTLGTFVFGLLEETEADIRETIDWMMELPLDFVSVNLLEIRPGSALWQTEVERAGSINSLFDDQEKYGTRLARGDQLQKLTALVKYANRRFYLRPTFMLKRAAEIRHLKDVTQLIYNALLVLKKR